MSRNYPSIGIQIADILLPKPPIDPQKWAAIACDQFTSEPEYWQSAEKFVADSPSTLKLIFPEVYLEQPGDQERIGAIQNNMRQILTENRLASHENLILVERTFNGKTRRGLMMALDLEKYDFNKGSQSLIRATEGTILERLPPRMRIREGAALELPHILVLVDDPQRTLIEPLVQVKNKLEKVYDFDLMLGSGHLSGWSIKEAALEKQVVSALENLAQPDVFQKKYAVGSDKGLLLYAVGDGNHSLATAKAIWEKLKPQVGMDHPARYALVEIENVHDDGLEFEPIHRILFGVKQDFQQAMRATFGDQFSLAAVKDEKEMLARVHKQVAAEHNIGIVSKAGFTIATIRNPASNLPVGTLQTFLDAWLKNGAAEKIDYVHGEEAVVRLGSQPGNLGFFLPAMQKSDLFKTVILDGALPRKTFSMGEAKEKRFYMECRKITL